MEKKDITKAVITAVLTTIVGIVFKYIDPPTVLTEIWQRIFVGPWFIWLGAAGFGVYWFVRLIIKLHHDTTTAIPALIKSQNEPMQKQLMEKTSQFEILHTSSGISLEQEKQNRFAGDENLSGRLNTLEINLRQDLKRELSALQTELSKLIGEEGLVRNETSAAISKRFKAESERMTKIEASLQQVIQGIKATDLKHAGEITALNKRVDTLQPPPPLTSQSYEGLNNSAPPAPTPREGLGLGMGLMGLANPTPRVPTPDELFSKAILERKNKNKT